MDDFKIIFWIILGLIYMFSRRKKADPSANRPRTTETEESASPSFPAPKTFEELLREIQGMKEPAPAPRSERTLRPAPEVVDYDDNLGEEEQDLEEKSSYTKREDKIYDVYEQAKAQAFYRPSLEETLKLEDTVVRFKQFKGYEKETRRNIGREFLKEFKDPQGFRKAFIMSEILKTKF